DGRSFDQGNSPPVIAAPTEEQRLRLRRLDQEIEAAEAEYDARARRSAGLRRRWEKSLLASGRDKAHQRRFPNDNDDNLIAHLAMDKNLAPVLKQSDRAYHDQNGGRKEEIGFKEGSPRYVKSPLGRGVAFDGMLYFDAGFHADFRYKSI